MKFKRLRLVGFKSFVDPVELVIEDGLTGILGPNGCGKSNLLEALRWVMGETSAKSMRGAGMEDVIFAGTDKRPARPFAEVILTLDNSERTAPALFNTADTLDISRRIAREMGSIYRVNGKETRARDIQVLFADASTGANSPALVRQGQIAHLIQAKPKARRLILEEAAGISGLHSRRYESELRLKATEQNLERLNDTFVAFEGQLANLARQAKQAQKYRALSSDIRRTEAAFLARLYHELLENHQKAETTLREALVEASTLERQVSALTQDETTALEKLPPLRDEVAISSAVLQKTKLEIATVEQQEYDLRGRIDRMQKALEGVKGDQNRESQLKEDSDKVLERLRTELEALRQEENQAPEREAALSVHLETLLHTQKEKEQLLEQATAQFHETQAQTRKLQEALDAARARKMRVENDFIRISKEKEQLEAQMQSDTRLEEARVLVQSLREKITVSKQTLDILEEQRGRLSAQEREEQSAHNAADQLAGRLQAEMKGLSAALGKDEQHSGGAVLHEMQVDVGFERAVGSSLGEDLNYGTDEKAARYWKQLPDFPQKSSFPEGVTPLSTYVQAPPVLTRALSHIGLAQDAQQASLLQPTLASGQQLVTEDGAIWRWDGLHIRSNAPSGAAVRLAQKNKLLHLEKEFSTAQAAALLQFERLKKVREEGLALHTKITEARGQMRTLEDHFAKALRGETDLERIYAGQTARQTALEEQLSRIDTELKLSIEAMDALLIDIQGLRDIDPLRETVDQHKKELERHRGQVAEHRAHLDNIRRQVRERKQRLEGLERDKREWDKRSQEATSRLDDLNKRRLDLEKNISEAEGQPEALQQKRQQALARLEPEVQRHQKAVEALSQGENAVNTLGKTLRDLQGQILSAQEKKVRAEGHIETLSARKNDMTTRIREALRIEPEHLSHEFDAQMQELPAVFLEKQLEQLKRDRDQLGPVNLVAEQEIEALGAERAKIIAERDDLIQAVARLRQGIDHLNKEGREKLLEAYEKVNAHFKRLFMHLFGGGVAELDLVESDDPLEAGLEILAQPPGKKTRSLSLMSGGEQALTCLALIFAVFLTNPSPICVLDEVDAPLDDANVGRYCDLLAEMTRVTETRFLVITHNPLTMSRMDRLFGVTMAERGVSQLVSVDLQAAERLVSVI